MDIILEGSCIKQRQVHVWLELRRERQLNWKEVIAGTKKERMSNVVKRTKKKMK